jgi:agmatinase
MSFYEKHAPGRREHNRPLPDLSQYEGMKAQQDEVSLPSVYAEKEKKRIKELGLEPADSIEDKSEISTFQRGSMPHWSGINTFLRAPYLEDVRKVGDYDVAFVGAPFDIGCTFRSGTRFGPQGIRRISALYQKYSYEHAVDLSESLKMCDVGDIFCRPTSQSPTTRSRRA